MFYLITISRQLLSIRRLFSCLEYDLVRVITIVFPVIVVPVKFSHKNISLVCNYHTNLCVFAVHPIAYDMLAGEETQRRPPW